MVEVQLKAGNISDQAWANATLAELALLSPVYDARASRNPSRLRDQVVNYCREIRRLMATSRSTCTRPRQFQRYLDMWKRDEWQDIAQAAIDALEL
jgi:hypothetical protein